MGNPKQKWTPEEEEALRAGIAKHGTGKWKDIQRDPEFHPFLASRSNIDLKDDLLEGLPNFVKDKWRNMSISAGIQGSRDKSRTSKTKATQVQDAHPPPPAAQLPTPQASSVASATVARYATSTPAVDDSSKGSSDGKTPPMYNAIFEALSTSKDPYGLETSRIVSYIEQRHEVPPNFRRLLSTRLRRLVAQDKIEKDQNFYRMKSDASLGTKTPTPDLKQEHSQLTHVQDVGCFPSIDPIKEAAEEAACCVADAEQKDAMLAESSRELEMIVKMQEQAEANLLLAKELYERWNPKLAFLIYFPQDFLVLGFHFRLVLLFLT